MNPNDRNFDPGGIKDRVDNRDYLYSEVGFGTNAFDWAVPYDIEKELGFKLPVKDQGNSFSCGGQAWATYIGILESLATSSFEERSAKYIYSQVYAPGGGSRGRDCADVCVSQGVARETALPSHQDHIPPTEMFMEKSIDITSNVRQDAISSRLISYAQVGNDINDIARALKANHGIILGIDGSNNGTWSGAFPKPPILGDTVWRHWIYAGKTEVINGIKGIWCLNSWGTNVGQNGWQWLSEVYFKHVWSAWTHTFGSQLIPGFHHSFSVDLQLNQVGDEVKALQTALQSDGEFPASVPPTGFYGQITEQAVKDFQKRYGIVSSGTPSSTGYGRVGSKTRAKLNQLFG